MNNHPANTASQEADRTPSQITPAQFHILLTLAEGERHGYAIMKTVQERTDGAVELGPGTLYRSIQQLLNRGLIEEMTCEPRGEGSGGKSRRVYALTPRGRARTREEALRLRALSRWAVEAMALEGGQP